MKDCGATILRYYMLSHIIHNYSSKNNIIKKKRNIILKIFYFNIIYYIYLFMILYIILARVYRN